MVGVPGRRTRKSTAESQIDVAAPPAPPEVNNSSANSVDSTASTASSAAAKPKKRNTRRSTRALETPPKVAAMTTRRQAARIATTKGGTTDRVPRYQSLRTAIFKNLSYRPLRAPMKPATWRSENKAAANGYTFKRGDIVALIDEEDEQPYFAQISAFLINPNGEPHAVVTYLIPLQSALDPHKFEVDHFVHGIAATDPIDLRECVFIQRCPGKESYQKNWTLKMCYAEQIRYELQERLRDLQEVSKAELSSYGTSRYYTEPLAPPPPEPQQLVEPKTEEDDLAESS